jgi:hypothetical protein
VLQNALLYVLIGWTLDDLEQPKVCILRIFRNIQLYIWLYIQLYIQVYIQPFFASYIHRKRTRRNVFSFPICFSHITNRALDVILCACKVQNPLCLLYSVRNDYNCSVHDTGTRLIIRCMGTSSTQSTVSPLCIVSIYVSIDYHSRFQIPSPIKCEISVHYRYYFRWEGLVLVVRTCIVTTIHAAFLPFKTFAEEECSSTVPYCTRWQRHSIEAQQSSTRFLLNWYK